MADLLHLLSPLGPDAEPGAFELQAQRVEKFRRAAQSALDRSRGGQTLDPDARRWALHWAAVPPLARPLTSGEPD